MATDYSGLFTTPQELQARAIKNLQDRQTAISGMGGSMDALLGQIAAGGGTTGGMMAQGIKSMFGLRTPEEARAAQAQEIMSGIKDSNDPQAYFGAAQQLNKLGFTKEALALTGQARTMRNEDLSYKKTLLEVNELQRVVATSPALRKILSQIDTSTPEGQRKAIQAASEVSTDEAYRLMELFYKQRKLNADMQMSGSPSFASGTMDILKDEEGNLFVQQPVTQTRGTGAGSTKINLVPMAGNKSDTPVGRTTVVEQYAESASEKQGRDISTAGGKVTAENFAQMRVTATEQIPQLRSQIANIDRAIQLAQEIQTGGFTNEIAGAAQRFFGVTPANKAEFAMLTSEIMYQRLKPLFGGVISDSERQAIEAVYSSIRQNPEANFALLGALKSSLSGAISRAEMVRDSSNFESYTQATKAGGDNMAEIEAMKADGTWEYLTEEERKIWER